MVETSSILDWSGRISSLYKLRPAIYSQHLSMESLLNLDEFELPFMKSAYDILENEVEDIDSIDRNHDAFDLMTGMVPHSAWELGSVEYYIQNFTEWTIRSTFYVIAGGSSDSFQWALFQLNWDDNEDAWHWEGLARMNGVAPSVSAQSAGEQMLRVHLDSRKIEINDEYKALLGTEGTTSRAGED